MKGGVLAISFGKKPAVGLAAGKDRGLAEEPDDGDTEAEDDEFSTGFEVFQDALEKKDAGLARRAFRLMMEACEGDYSDSEESA